MAPSYTESPHNTHSGRGRFSHHPHNPTHHEQQDEGDKWKNSDENGNDWWPPDDLSLPPSSTSYDSHPPSYQQYPTHHNSGRGEQHMKNYPDWDSQHGPHPRSNGRDPYRHHHRALSDGIPYTNPMHPSHDPNGYLNLPANHPPYNSTSGLNTTEPATSTGPVIIVRGEEIGIVLVVLLLWVGAIILFFNRWGKIRMLEPYQPKFCEAHRPSCPMAEVTSLQQYPRTYSKFNLSTEMMGPHFAKCSYHGVGVSNVNYGGLGPSTSRPRQNSVFVTSPHSVLCANTSVLQKASRKTKSAIDLSTLVLSEEFLENDQESDNDTSEEADDQLMELQRLRKPRVSLALEGEIISGSGKRKPSN